MNEEEFQKGLDEMTIQAFTDDIFEECDFDNSQKIRVARRIRDMGTELIEFLEKSKG